MKKRGKIIESVVRKSNIPIAQVARKLGYERTAPYQHFKKDDLDLGIVLQYGKALNHDFSTDLPELLDYVSTVQEPLSSYKSMTLSEALSERDYWKDKYIKLLEKHNDMILGQLNEK